MVSLTDTFHSHCLCNSRWCVQRFTERLAGVLTQHTAGGLWWQHPGAADMPSTWSIAAQKRNSFQIARTFVSDLSAAAAAWLLWDLLSEHTVIQGRGVSRDHGDDSISDGSPSRGRQTKRRGKRLRDLEDGCFPYVAGFIIYCMYPLHPDREPAKYNTCLLIQHCKYVHGFIICCICLCINISHTLTKWQSPSPLKKPLHPDREQETRCVGRNSSEMEFTTTNVRGGLCWAHHSSFQFNSVLFVERIFTN